MKRNLQHPFITTLTCCYYVRLGLLPREPVWLITSTLVFGLRPVFKKPLWGQRADGELHCCQKRGTDSLTSLLVGKTKVSIFSKNKGPGNKADAHNSSLELPRQQNSQ